MNWKLYNEALMFAEESDESDEPEEEFSGGGEESEESDIDKLRSTYDATIADLRKELKALKEQSDKDSTDSVWNTAYANAKREVDGFLEKLSSEKDPAKAVEYAKSALAYLAPKYGSYAASNVKTDLMYKNAEAERFAYMLKAEVGGDTNSHKAALMDSKTIDEMRLKFERMQFELSKKQTKRESRNPDAPRIDRGRGGAARTNVLREMEDIDLSTPEGRKQWQEKRSQFQRKLSSASR